jgi:hypothetical protein
MTTCVSTDTNTINQFTVCDNQQQPPALEIRTLDGADSSFKILNDGTVFWKGHEIVGDSEFVDAVKDLSQFLSGVAFSEVDRLLENVSIEEKYALCLKLVEGLPDLDKHNLISTVASSLP